MIFRPKQLGSASLKKEELMRDKKSCKKYGPCGVGKKALYLNRFGIDRLYYVPFASVKRIYKRIAMSKGGYSGKGLFATIPYLVVVYDNGWEKQCSFKIEEDVDRLLAYVKEEHPEIPLHSREAEQRLAEKERILAAKRKKDISVTASNNIEVLKQCSDYLRKKADLYTTLSISAKRKRTYERSNPTYKWAALFITILGLVSLVYGIYSVMTHAGIGIYFLLFGFATIFFFASANVLPTARNNRRAIEKSLQQAVLDMENYIKAYPEFPIPAQYAHPVVAKRLEGILAEGRAETIPEALVVLKKDLKALNSSVAVEQEEYEEIVAIKPMFLVMDYK
jgi:hypothetical protein